MAFTVDSNKTTLIDQRAIQGSEPLNVINLGNISSSCIIDCSLGIYFTATVTGNVTISINNPPAIGLGGGFIFYLTNGGNYEITWPDSVTWSCGLEPDFTPNGTDILVFYTYDAGMTYYGFLSAANLS